MAVVVAIAGGTSRWGQTLIEQLQKENGKFEVIVLTRGEPKKEGNTDYVQVDYTDIPALAATLDRHAVHVIISVISMMEDSRSEAQLNLIDAAKKARTVKKFIPSEYIYNTDEKYLEIDPGLNWWLATIERLKNSNLQYTRVFFGTFMDYLGLPAVRTHILSPYITWIHTVRSQALLPGDGSARVSMTYSYDAATYMVKLLDLEEWPEFSGCVGEDTNFNTVIKELEDVSKKSMQVTYIDAKDINSGKTKQVEAVLADYADSELSVEDLVGFYMLGSQLLLAGALDIPQDYRLDLGFKPKSLRQFLSEVFEAKA